MKKLPLVCHESNYQEERSQMVEPVLGCLHFPVDVPPEFHGEVRRNKAEGETVWCGFEPTQSLDSFGPDTTTVSTVNLKRIPFIVLCCVACCAAHCQVTWRRTYGGLGISEARCVRQTIDGGYVVGGSTGSFGNGSSDIYLLRMDELGDPVWSRVYGGIGVDNAIACRELPDGFIIAGTTSTGTNGSYDMLLIRTDLQGEPLWERNYGTSSWELCNAMELLPDGFILGGISYGGGMLNGAAYVVKTDLNGDTLWTRTYGGPYRMECNGLTRTTDQGIVLAGSIGTTQGPEDGFVAKLDDIGEQLWITILGGDSTDVFRSVVEDSSGNIVACGVTNSGLDVSRIYLASVDGTGQYLWEQFIGNTADAGGAEIRNRLYGGFVFTGYNTLNLGAKDMILTTTDNAGYFQFGNNFGDGHPAEGFSIDATMDGGYVVAGWAEGYGPGQRAMYVVKADSLGQTLNLNVVPYSDPLPVEELGISFSPSLFPNALSSFEQLHLLVPIYGSTTARITDLRGAVVANIPVNGGESPSIRIPQLAPGPYLVTIIQGGKPVLASKFVVVD